MIRLGIIGLGYWGPNLVRVFSELPGSSVVRVSDLDESRLNAISHKFPTVEKTRDYRDIINDSSIDAVVVTTNLTAHFKIVLDALNAGKHVLVEKPLTDTVERSKKLVNAARKSGKLLMVGHTFLFNAGVLKLKDYIRTREIGGLMYMHATRTNLGPIRKDANALWDLASHDISVFLHLVGEMPTEVTASGGTFLRNGVEDAAFLTLRFPGNIIGNIHVSWLEPCKVRKITLIGDKKMVVFDDIDQLEPIKIYDKGVIKEKRYENFGEFQLILRDGDVLVPKIRLSEPLKNECAEFIEAVKNGSGTLSDGIFGQNVVKVLCAAQKSLKHNGRPERIK